MATLNGSDHVDRGDGVCKFCFADFPCEGSQGAVWSGVQAHEQEEWITDYNAKKAKREDKITEINATFERLGIDWQMSTDCVGQMIDVDSL